MESRGSVTVTQSYLKKVIDFTSSSLVGKLLKRFEILDDKQDVKKVCKELIYEEFRQLRDLIIGYDQGVEDIKWEFKLKSKGR